MLFTNYEHACFAIDMDDQRLVVDPGGYTTDFTATDSIVAVVLTHAHPDHKDMRHLRAIRDANPDVAIIGHTDVISDLEGFALRPVVANEGIKIGPFELEFFGGDHAVIHPSIDVIANLGVMINGAVYYPGDSFALPERPVRLLALPVAAPWLKLSEAVEFIRAVRPQQAVPTHDAVLSETGKSLPDRLVPLLTSDLDITYNRPDSPIEL